MRSMEAPLDTQALRMSTIVLCKAWIDTIIRGGGLFCRTDVSCMCFPVAGASNVRGIRSLVFRIERPPTDGTGRCNRREASEEKCPLETPYYSGIHDFLIHAHTPKADGCKHRASVLIDVEQRITVDQRTKHDANA